MQLIEFGELTDEYRLALEGDELDPFETAGVSIQHFQPKPRHVGITGDDGRLTASAGLVPEVPVEVGEARFPVVGLGGVIVNAGHRGQGLARRVVAAAIERGAELGPELMMLFCLPSRVGLYERLEFALLPHPVEVRQPDGPAQMPLETMWRPLRPGARWPAGRVRLLDLPF